jgi:hypothetical protein
LRRIRKGGGVGKEGGLIQKKRKKKRKKKKKEGRKLLLGRKRKKKAREKEWRSDNGCQDQKLPRKRKKEEKKKAASLVLGPFPDLLSCGLRGRAVLGRRAPPPLQTKISLQAILRSENCSTFLSEKKRKPTHKSTKERATGGQQRRLNFAPSLIALVPHGEVSERASLVLR